MKARIVICDICGAQTIDDNRHKLGWITAKAGVRSSETEGRIHFWQSKIHICPNCKHSIAQQSTKEE